RSELQPDVFVTAAGAFAEVDPAWRRVDMVAADAVESRLPPFALKPAVIATIVVQPEPEKKQAHKRAEDDRAGGEIEHAPSKRSLPADSRKLSRAANPPAKAINPFGRKNAQKASGAPVTISRAPIGVTQGTALTRSSCASLRPIVLGNLRSRTRRENENAPKRASARDAK
ncbi:MAG TPA: hypothetical protein VMC06_14705, partial [Opitutaceae bacterium]|nr:hypothetical protein [Opitutaceae bacterium]